MFRYGIKLFQMKYQVLVLLLIPLLFTNCEKDFETIGKSPVYISYEDSSVIKRLPPQDFNDLGKIIISGNYIFINEKEKGLHVINNSDPANPVKEHFWQIPGNTEFTIFQDILYADNGKHLWVIDVGNYHHIKVTNIIRDQYMITGKEYYPFNYSGYFECFRAELGIFNGWQDTELINPLCKTE